MSRIKFTFCLLLLFLARNSGDDGGGGGGGGGGIGRGTKKLQQTNLLFIMFDDLRPELSIYGKYHIISPNFARLAAKSVVFDHAYAQISVCNPSRDSLLTGLRPDTVGTYGFQSTYMTYNQHMIIPTKLKRAGYRTVGLGKTRHFDGYDQSVWDRAWDNRWYDYQVTSQSALLLLDNTRSHAAITYPLILIILSHAAITYPLMLLSHTLSY